MQRPTGAYNCGTDVGRGVSPHVACGSRPETTMRPAMDTPFSQSLAPRPCRHLPLSTTGEVIPGTEMITPGPGIQLDDMDLGGCLA